MEKSKPGFMIEEESDMKRLFPIGLAILVLMAVSLTFIAVDSSTAGEAKEMAADTVDMEAAKVTFEETCAKCHALSRPLGKKKDQAGWENTVERMSSYHKRQKGKAISEEDQMAIVQYLLSVAGK
jgi:mono/diheme cytochrome c family protein